MFDQINELHWIEFKVHTQQVEMEEQKLANQTDYWLVQYQRLLDSKPQSLIDQVRP